MKESDTTPRVTQAGKVGGVLAMLVSGFLFVWVEARDVDFNALNLFTIVVAALAGVLSVRGSRREDGAGLGWGIVLLLIAMAPAVFGFVAFLYLPSLILLLISAAAFVTTTEQGTLQKS